LLLLKHKAKYKVHVLVHVFVLCFQNLRFTSFQD
jgi:hypothetical protein